VRPTVDKILNNEARRLYEKSVQTGLTAGDLTYLDKLIQTYTTFVGSPSQEPGSEASKDPAVQSTEDLLKAVLPAPE
jgi:hypothetical protein